jgi:Domain of unknown function (DUF2405)
MFNRLDWGIPGHEVMMNVTDNGANMIKAMKAMNKNTKRDNEEDEDEED